MIALLINLTVCVVNCSLAIWMVRQSRKLREQAEQTREETRLFLVRHPEIDNLAAPAPPPEGAGSEVAWPDAIFGTFADSEEYEAAMRLGREYRKRS